MSKHSAYSSILVRMPSFLKGAARVNDLYGTIDKYRSTGDDSQNDKHALARDWRTVGRDIMTAVKQYGRTTGKKPAK